PWKRLGRPRARRLKLPWTRPAARVRRSAEGSSSRSDGNTLAPPLHFLGFGEPEEERDRRGREEDEVPGHPHDRAADPLVGDRVHAEALRPLRVRPVTTTRTAP